MVDLTTEVEAFNETSDWSSQATPPPAPAPWDSALVPEFRPSVPDNQFHYRNMPFTNSSLSLVVCSSMHGVFTPKDTAQMVSQQQQDLLLGRTVTGDDIKAILEKIIVQNSPAFQSLKSVDPTSSLVQAILAPMVSAGFVPVRTPTTPPSIPWLWTTRRGIPSDPAEDCHPSSS